MASAWFQGNRGWFFGLAMVAAMLSPLAGFAAELIVDGGTTFTLSRDITNDRVIVGLNSTGALVQANFTNTVNVELFLGQNLGSNGLYTLNAGGLEVRGDVVVGDGGTGEFTQTGGVHTTSANLSLGNQFEGRRLTAWAATS